MCYSDKITCPHCKQDIELEVDIEGYGDYAYANINPIDQRFSTPQHGKDGNNGRSLPLELQRKGGEKNEVNMERQYKLRDGSHTSQALHGDRR